MGDATSPAVGVADAVVTELGVDGDSGDWKVDVTFELSAPAPGKIAVGWSTVDGSAVAGQDYRAAAGTMWIPTGVTRTGVTSKSLRLELINDQDIEPSEFFGVEVVSVVGAVTIGDGRGDITIVDDDSVPTVVVGDDIEIVEGSGGGGRRAQTEVEVALRLSNPYEKIVKVQLSTGGGTASAGWWGQRRFRDYAPFVGRGLFFLPGTTERTVTLVIYRDDVIEPDETIPLTVLSDRYSNYVIDPARTSTTITILDDD